MTFKNRRLELFGRGSDLEFLIGRALTVGFTAVVGRPRMGKSWLLTEVARVLSEERGQLVGYAGGEDQTTGLMPQALCDLYVRWLANASHRQRAVALWERYKGGLSPGTARAVTGIFKGLESAVTPVALARLIKTSLHALGSAGTDLGPRALLLAPIDDEQTRELTNLVVDLSQRGVILILDGWESSHSRGCDYRMLQAFLDQLDDWRACHVFACLRPEGTVWTQIQASQAASPAACLFRLPPMRLGPEEERQMLTRFVQQRVPAARSLDEDDLLEMVQGFPGVLERWLDLARRGRLTGAADLRTEAENARQYHYPEFDDLLSKLSADERRLAMRLALFLPIDHEGSEGYRSTWFEGLDAKLVFALRAKMVIENEEGRPFGHGIRQAAVRRWFCRNHRPQMAAEVEALVFRLGIQLKGLDPTAWPFLTALAALARIAGTLNLSAAARAVTAAAVSLFPGEPCKHGGMRLVLAAGRDAIQKERRVTPLLSMALFNALIRATVQGDPSRSNLFLNELRGLHWSWPEDAAVREALAAGLLHAFAAASDRNQHAVTDPFLDELRGLHQGWPEDAAVREALALGLLNAFLEDTEESDVAPPEGLLQELHCLQQRWPDDVRMREVLSPFTSTPGIDPDNEGFFEA